MSERVRAWAPALLWAAFIFAASSRPTLPVGLGSGRDKVAHFVVYALLGILLARGQRRSGAPVWLALVLGLVYAASDELHQSLVPGRSAELADWLADALGVGAGVAFHHRRRSRPRVGTARAGGALSESVRT